MTATLRDVAKLAGVSISTASRALREDHARPVAMGTRDRIREAVRQLEYEPNDAAQHLVRGMDDQARRTNSAGFVLGNVSYKFSDPFWSPVLDGVADELIRHGYHLGFAVTVDDLKRLQQRRLLTRAHIDGLILAGIRPFGKGIGRERTVVIEGGDDRVRWDQRAPVDVITIEKRRAMYRLVGHLVALGRRRFAFLGPPPSQDERAEAFVQALACHGLPLDPAYCIPTPWSAEGAYPFAKAVLASADVPDALVCGCDTIAIGAMRAAKERGLRLPDDLAITGFDDVPFARDLDPPLTTVRVPKETMGVVAARKLMERIDQPTLAPVVQVIPTGLVVRASCGAPTGRGARARVTMDMDGREVIASL